MFDEGLPVQMSNSENKNCSELLLTNGIGSDEAPINFFTLGFLKPPYKIYGGPESKCTESEQMLQARDGN